MLGELFTRFGSDKDREHSYGPVYDELFYPYRETATALLEIGVMHGASLFAWRAYFPHAQITGMDHWATPIVDERIRTVRADSTKLGEVREGFALEGVKTPFDIIVDDGCHWLDDQRATWQNLREYLRPGGIYVIEDLQSTEAMDWFRDAGFEIRDLRTVKNRGDDIMAIHRG